MTIDTIKKEMGLSIEQEEDGILTKAFEILEDIRDGLQIEISKSGNYEIEFIDGTDFNFYKLKQIVNDICELLQN